MDYKTFDKMFFSKFVGKKLKNILENKSLTISEVAKKMDVAQPHLSNALNGRKLTSTEWFMKVGQALGLSESEFTKILDEAKKAEYEHTTGNKIGSDEDFDFEVALRKEYGQELDDYTVEKIKDFIEHVKFLKKNEK